MNETVHTAEPLLIERDEVTILFAGDSGDGMQLTGTQFSETSALLGNDINTFPNYPAEIRAPAGTLPGVSGFQIHFGSKPIYTPGDQCDVLVVMNVAALRVNLKSLKKGGMIIANTSGFDEKSLDLAGLKINPLDDESLSGYEVHKVDVSKLTRLALEGTAMGTKEIDRSKNMFVLGMIYWLYNRPLENSIKNIKEKFKKKPELADANLKVLNAGFNFASTLEIFSARYVVKPAKLPSGTYRHITGNEASAIALIAASQKSGLPLYLGSYPITPASDILHELSKHKNFGVRTFQAEDEIAAICAAIGASYGGSLAVTTTSGPGMDLKAEAMGLAVSLELPLVIINVQRGGPSTGLPTKTEQSDLLSALYGRHGESPIPVIAAQSPSDCFHAVYEAASLAVHFMTPVICLTDGYIANSTEPWRFPTAETLTPISVSFEKSRELNDPKFQPYRRDDNLARPWAIPGTKGLEHRVGGLEKEHLSGNISYDGENHELMTRLRAEKVSKIADAIPNAVLDSGADSGKVLVVGWGSTYGAIKTAVTELQEKGNLVSHLHLRHLNPLPNGLGEILSQYRYVLVPELNSGQLIKVLREKYLVPAIGYNKVQGLPFTVAELKNKINELLTKEN
ncbi:MAG: 2-oxoacid:acceptor oxidoreductase subunit alpha [Chloroherpetonaceae bacterium]|nr:2-oxoacid:acceptor oxidoreductase subunit alpha [Chloroherpetonaceae bacterium]